jgi:hypothetical protein
MSRLSMSRVAVIWLFTMSIPLVLTRSYHQVHRGSVLLCLAMVLSRLFLVIMNLVMALVPDMVRLILSISLQGVSVVATNRWACVELTQEKLCVLQSSRNIRVDIVNHMLHGRQLTDA